MYPLYSNIIVVMQVIFICYQVVMRIIFFILILKYANADFLQNHQSIHTILVV
jgi:hypothetical protein